MPESFDINDFIQGASPKTGDAVAPQPASRNLFVRNPRRAWAIVGCVFGCIFGGIFVLFGWLAGKQASGASPTPVPAELAKLEAGQPLQNIHVQLGKHLRDYPHAFFWYESIGHAPATPGSKVKEVFVPLVSLRNPYAIFAQALGKKHKGLDKVPENELPPLKNFVVLLCTDRYEIVSDIPRHAELADAQHGLVNNHMVGLEDEERDLIRKNLPGIDTDKILILLDDKSPASDLIVGLLKYGGGAMIVVGILAVIFVKGEAKKELASGKK